MKGKSLQVNALVDSGATTTFIHRKLVTQHRLATHKLKYQFNVYNADGTINKNGKVDHSVTALLKINGHKSTNKLLVADLENKDLMIGMAFIHQHNPEINWCKGIMKFSRCPNTCTTKATLQKEINILPDNDVENAIDDKNNPHI